jgi:hypothetical protein
MKKMIIVAFLQFVSIVIAFGQKKEILILDSLNFQKLSFGGVFLGDSVNKVINKFGKQNEIKFYDGKGEMEDFENPQNTYIYSKNKKSIGFLENIRSGKNKIASVDFNNFISLDNYISINEDLKSVAKKYPNSYKYAIRKRKINKEENGVLYLKVYNQLKDFLGVVSVNVIFVKGKVTEIYTPKDE